MHLSDTETKVLETIECISNVLQSRHPTSQIPLHEPNFDSTNAAKYLQNCLDTRWVSSGGHWVNRFEDTICQYTNAKYAVAVTNGTVGLRLALYTCGVLPGDEVILPSLTFVATANAISHLGAIPHFVDIENRSFGICPDKLASYLHRIVIFKNNKPYNKNTGNRIAAIVPVHVFGNPCSITELLNIASNWHLPLVEDAAEALGSWLNGIHCGTFGSAGIISFNGNKILTTGGGGMLITNNDTIFNKSRHLSTTAKISHPWEFIHDFVGWNDRLPNLNAALGVSQMEVLQQRLDLKRQLYKKYSDSFLSCSSAQIIKSRTHANSNNWLISLRINLASTREVTEFRHQLMDKALKLGFGLRPVWHPIHFLSMYKQSPKDDLSVTNNEFLRLISLPSSAQLIHSS